MFLLCQFDIFWVKLVIKLIYAVFLCHFNIFHIKLVNKLVHQFNRFQSRLSLIKQAFIALIVLELHEVLEKIKIEKFVNIPWPSSKLFRKLDLRSLKTNYDCQADLLSFQTHFDPWADHLSLQTYYEVKTNLFRQFKNPITIDAKKLLKDFNNRFIIFMFIIINWRDNSYKSIFAIVNQLMIQILTIPLRKVDVILT